MENLQYAFKGLSAAEVAASREKFGPNSFDSKKENPLLMLFASLVKEPMIILLLLASLLYFIAGDMEDAIFMVAAIILVAAISIYQDSRSRNALEKLRQYSQPDANVIRDGQLQKIKTEEIVVGDIVQVSEGNFLPADGKILQSNDFSVNESILTGESFSVFKSAVAEDANLFSGTIATGGLAIFEVNAVGNQTKIGQIGKRIESISNEKSPLEKQVTSFVKKMVIIGGVAFVIVWIFNYLRNPSLIDSLLKALTLAMSILPEEIPVAFTTFMALGSLRLLKMGVVVKQMQTAEALGSATFVCTDKTGTLTENKMQLVSIFTPSGSFNDSLETLSQTEKELLRVAMFASEPIPFDPMEIALHNAYAANTLKDERPAFEMIHEYPLDGVPPMMTHIFEDKTGRRVIAAKGAPEAILEVSGLDRDYKAELLKTVVQISANGLRVLGVAEAHFIGTEWPQRQQQFNFDFKGFVAFLDPPRKNINQVLQTFEKAGIKVKIVTGDNASTTRAVAKAIGFKEIEKAIEGQVLATLPNKELKDAVNNNAIFSRMYPEAKLELVNALKEDGEVVAMIGDGVNDGAALRAAHIGVAMGKKGTEIAKQAASLILVNDDFSKLADAVAMGRRIYSNLKKAIQYIISIHIPIILVVFIPLVLGWVYPNIFTPVHVIFLELIMGPTCSIIFENEPMEKMAMHQPPRDPGESLFSATELSTSIIQGLAITAGALFIYKYAVWEGMNENHTRAMVFVTLITANIFLTLVNRSFYYSIFKTLTYKNVLVPLIIIITVILTALFLYIAPLADFFKFETPSPKQVLICIAAGAASTLWFEIPKMIRRNRSSAY